jgi:uncharacterized protein
MSRSSELAGICERFGVATLWVFGSRSREVFLWLNGATTTLSSGPSDVDVGILPTSGFLGHVRERVELILALEQFLGCERVDLVMLPESDPFVAVAVISGERPYAEDDHRADEYELYIMRRAGDLVPLERERMALILDS